MLLKIFLIMSLMIALSACGHKIVKTFEAQPSAIQDHHPIQPLQIPEEYSSAAYQGLRFGPAIFNFYSTRAFKPFWLQNNARSPLADSMIMVIRSARRFGLLPQDYHFQEIPELVLEPANQHKMVRLDMLLTDSFFGMINDLSGGRSTRSMWHEKMDSVGALLLSDSLKPQQIRALLNAQEPVLNGYLSLKNALNGILDTVNRTDYHLLMHGITLDSIDVHHKVQRIEINLERWRQEIDMSENLYAFVNVPAYMFYMMDNGNIVMDSRVIVGTPNTPTPQFSSKIECFTIFPYWYVPRKITVNEYLPTIKRDSTFIRRNNFDVLDRNGKIQELASIDWKAYHANNFPFTLRQREGTENSLGVLKFIFDNPYAVFLHDTNAKRLFQNKKRAYSHGCIRLEKASQFAHYLISGNRTKVTSATLDKYLSEKKRITISLLEPVPIHIRYLTCELRQGQLMIYDDIYKKDRELIRTLYQKKGMDTVTKKSDVIN